MNGLLFIDDEEGMRRSVVRALQRESYPVFTAENGEAGVQFVQDHISDIGTVISDLKCRAWTDWRLWPPSET